MIIKSLFKYFTFFILLTQFTNAWASEPAFEGYYKINLGDQHSGYVVQKFDIDDKKKEMTSTYYIYVKTPNGTTIESLVAKSDFSFEPTSYDYSALINGTGRKIEARFKDKKMAAKIIANGKTQNATLKIPANGFMSTFLNYVMLKNGLMVGKNYEFYALAEEAPTCFAGDATCAANQTGFLKGSAAIKSEEKYKGVPAYRVDFNFKGVAFIGILSATGETLASVSPMQNASTELVATRQEAVAAFPFSEKNIKTIFGNIPLGKKNSLNASTQNLPKSTSTLTTQGSGQASDQSQ